MKKNSWIGFVAFVCSLVSAGPALAAQNGANSPSALAKQAALAGRTSHPGFNKSPSYSFSATNRAQQQYRGQVAMRAQGLNKTRMQGKTKVTTCEEKFAEFKCTTRFVSSNSP